MGVGGWLPGDIIHPALRMPIKHNTAGAGHARPARSPQASAAGQPPFTACGRSSPERGAFWGNNGAFAYGEAWYGFSVNKDADEKELAVEFLRFMAYSDQIEKLASIKGMPAVNNGAGVYTSAADAAKAFVASCKAGE